jgi:hypothetical protein
MSPLKCDDVKDCLVDYLEFELPMQRREQFYEHLMSCDECRALHDKIQSVLAQLKQDDIKDPGQEYWDNLANNVFHEVKQVQRHISAELVDSTSDTRFNPDRGSNIVTFPAVAPAQAKDAMDQARQPGVESIEKPQANRPVISKDVPRAPANDSRSARLFTGHWFKFALPVAAAVLVGVAATLSLLEKPVPDTLQDSIGFQAQIQSEQSLAQLTQKIAPLAQPGNHFGFSSQAGVFSSFAIGSMFSEARALTTGEQTAPLKTHLALLKTALLGEKDPQYTLVGMLQDTQRQLNTQNNFVGMDARLVALFNQYLQGAETGSRQRAELAKAGAWLFDYALAALAQDADRLRQAQQLQAFKRALQNSDVPPGVIKSFDRLISVAGKAQLEQKDYRQVVKDVENIRSLLG